MTCNNKEAWKIKYKESAVMSYLGFLESSLSPAVFKPKYKFGSCDLFGLMSLIKLAFSRDKKLVICVPDREDMIQLGRVIEGAAGQRAVWFIRRESSRGNTFFIDVVRYLFRKTNRVLRRRKVKYLEACLSDLSCGACPQRISEFVGDYHYNLWLSWFLKGHQVFFTNSIVPKVAMYSKAYHFSELQHGVIYHGHPDYTSIPSDALYGKLFAWNSYWKDKLVAACNYGGEVVVGDYHGEKVISTVDKKDFLVLSTVNEEFSRKIDVKSLSHAVIRLHPRDYYKYRNVSLVARTANLGEYRYILCHDTTLIKVMIDNGIKFYYLKLDNETIDGIIRVLNEKYGAVNEKDFEIITAVSHFKGDRC